MNNKQIFNFLDSLAILVLGLILSGAFAFQILDQELPCALCVMQRMGLYAIGYGLVLNLLKERTEVHYLLVIAASLINSTIALLQVVLHIVPGSGSFGAAIMGMHMYTWNFVISLLFIVYSLIAGLSINGFAVNKLSNKPSVGIKVIIGFFVFTLIANIISAFIECGPHLCPSDPTSYWLIDKFTGKVWE